MPELFEILRGSPRPNIHLTLPAGAAVVGLAYQESDTAGVAELATGVKPIVGFSTRPVVVGGPALGDHVFPGRLELPFTPGQEGSFEHAEEIECEGANYVDSGITGATALNTALSFTAGKFKVRAGGEIGMYHLVALPTPITGGNVRIRVRQISL